MESSAVADEKTMVMAEVGFSEWVESGLYAIIAHGRRDVLTFLPEDVEVTLAMVAVGVKQQKQVIPVLAETAGDKDLLVTSDVQLVSVAMVMSEQVK